MMKRVAVLCVMVAAACQAAGPQSPTAQSATAIGSFASSGAAVSESVDPDGTKRGECAFSDNTGQRIRVRYVLRPGVNPEFLLVEGDRGQDPAAAYTACMEIYRQNQANAQSAFSMGFNQFFNPFLFNPFAFNPFIRNQGKNFDEDAAEPFNDVLSTRAGSFVNQMGAQNRILEQRNQQLQENLRRLEQQNLDMQRRIMAQVAG